MRSRSNLLTSHRESSEIRNVETLGDVYSSHGGGRLDQYVRVLAGDPRVVEEIIEPTTEASERFLEESWREHLREKP